MARREVGMARYLIVLEEAAGNWAAFSPDVPGCVATGATREEARASMVEALAFHLESMQADGDVLPDGRADAGRAVVAEIVDVPFEVRPGDRTDSQVAAEIIARAGNEQPAR